MVERRIVDRRALEAGGSSVRLACFHELALPDGGVAPQPPGAGADRPGPPAEGETIDCVRCERAELPEGLRLVRTTDEFDQDTVPRGLLRRHRVADGVWGVLVVDDGTLGFHLDTDPPLDVVLTAGERQPIPPAVTHEVRLRGPARFRVEFHTA